MNKLGETQNIFDEEGRPMQVHVKTGLAIPETVLARLDHNYDKRVHSMSSMAFQYEQFKSYAETTVRSLTLCVLGATIRINDQ